MIVNGASCLSSSSSIYLCHKGRMAVGIEHLRMVGFFASTAALKEFSSSLLKDLAGNAFDGGCYLAASLTLFRIAAECHTRKKQQASQRPRRLLSAVWSGSACDSDSE